MVSKFMVEKRNPILRASELHLFLLSPVTSVWSQTQEQYWGMFGKAIALRPLRSKYSGYGRCIEISMCQQVVGDLSAASWPACGPYGD